MMKKNELKVSELRYFCDPKIFKFKNTSELEPLDEVIGQERAGQAIEFGLNMKSPGYNIFVTGMEGTGKSTIIRDIVNEYAGKNPVPFDWCMVNNFKDEFRPKAIRVPSGKAIYFAKAMGKFIEDMIQELPDVFESETYIERINRVRKKYSEKQKEIYEKTEESARKKNIQINRTKVGFQAIPIINEKPVTPDEFRKLPKKEQDKINKDIGIIQEEVENSIREINKINMALHADIEKMMDEVTLFVVKGRLDIIKGQYSECPDIIEFLDDIRTDIVENVNIFIASEGNSKEEDFLSRFNKSPMDKYKVNVLVDRRFDKGAPVIFETNPTYQNVFGQIEKRAYMGTVTTDFSLVQAGSLLRANGGYLIMEVESVLMHSFVWEALKRALQNKLLAIEDIAMEAGYGTSSLRPEPIPLDVKVILLGNYEPFRLLQDYDSKFNKIFKVRADFDNEVERNDKSTQKYAKFVARACKEEKLLPFTPEGVAAIVEFGEKNIADKNKLSLRFGTIMGIIKEADYWARSDKSEVITAEFVRKAYTEHRFRYNLYEEKMHESYIDNTIMIDVKDEVVGQVNALAVYQLGDISFGRPSRITAETYMGKKGIINIERESNLSGNTHNKGVYILSGYMGRTFAQKYPLSLTISITFEQSYGGIDGDSASSTELYAILSSLSEVPINQGIAITGSVNQKGQVQAIGGVNQKIEGFFDVCLSKGLTGKQGVMIPQSNVKNLMLKREVIDAVKEGKFHVYQVSTIEEGIEILTGHAAGKPDKDGIYPDDSVYGRVQQKLKKYLERAFAIKKEFEDNNNAV